MNVIWDWLKYKKPISIALKIRNKNDITIACNSNLEFSYLNATASFMLKECNGLISIDEILSKYIETYDVDEKQLQFDIIELIRLLQWKKLIKLMD